MNEEERITDMLRHLPGVGPRQAERMLSFLLASEHTWFDRLLGALQDAKVRVRACQSCRRRFFPGQNETYCALCSDPERESGSLMVVEKEADLQNIERSGAYRGLYFMLGIHTFADEARRSQAFDALKRRMHEGVNKNNGVTEIILALSATPDSEETADALAGELAALCNERGIRIVRLGRGLSTGSELEYADKETIRNALARRQ